MERESLVNRYISVPRDKGSLNCAVFVAGIIEAVLTGTGFVSILKKDGSTRIMCKIYIFIKKIRRLYSLQ